MNFFVDILTLTCLRRCQVNKTCQRACTWQRFDRLSGFSTKPANVPIRLQSPKNHYFTPRLHEICE